MHYQKSIGIMLMMHNQLVATECSGYI